MSYEDYVQYITQKYMLAVKIAVIQSKPENMTLEEHLQQLKNKIREQIDSDFNVSFCSDDFQLNDNDEFDKDLDENDAYIGNCNESTQENYQNYVNNCDNTTTHVVTHSTPNVLDINVDQNNDKAIIQDTHHNDYNKNNQTSKATNAEILNTQGFNDCLRVSQKTSDQNEAYDIDMINTQDLNNSITILTSLNKADKNIFENNKATEQRNNLDEVLALLKDIDNNMDHLNDTVTQTGHNILQTEGCEQLEDIQCVDDDATLSDLNNLPYVDMHILTIQGQKWNSKATVSITDNHIKKSLHRTDLDSQDFVDLEGNERNLTKICDEHADISSSSVGNTGINKPTDMNNNKNCDNNHHGNKSEAKPLSPMRQYRNTKEFKNIYQNVAGLFKRNKNINEENNDSNTDRIDLTKEVKEIPENSQQNKDIALDVFTCNTHYSESQVNEIIKIDDKYIHGTYKNSGRQNHKNTPKEPKIYNENDSLNKKDLVCQEKYATNRSNLSANNSQTYDTLNHNISIMHTNNQIDLEDNVPLNKRKTVTCIENNEHHTAKNSVQVIKDENKKYTKRRKAIHIDNAGFAQESQLTNFSTSKSPTFDENTYKLLDENVNNVKNKYKEFINGDTITKSKPRYIDNDLFSQSELSNNEKYMTEITLAHSQDDLINIEIDDFLDNETLNLKDYVNTYDTKQMQKLISKQENKPNSLSDNNIASVQVSQNLNINNDKRYINNDEGFTNNLNETQNFKDSLNVYDYNEHITQKNSLIPLNTYKNHSNAQNKPLDENLNITATNQMITNDDGTEMMHEVEKRRANFDDIKKKDHSKTKADNVSKNNAAKENCVNFNNADVMEFEELTDSEAEVIPFKVIEELNEVKKYLNRGNDMNYTDGLSSDAGYRSDSGSRRSCKTLSQNSQSSSGVRMNQSAYSLLKHITQCQMTRNTQDITEEISEVLGQLIDRLHEEELYPSFLEEMLDTVQSMLGDVYEESCGPQSLAKKDVTIHRIVLLNKSVHIQKYTIDKISLILENIHKEISTSDTVYDIESIDKLENICYIFHALEILLKNYSTTQNSTQSTQNLSPSTQDEKVLKRSSIADIWRKKWNPNSKHSSNENIRDKVCPMSRCSAVLNKLVVGCMENYSLVSFYALKCFNVMQN